MSCPTCGRLLDDHTPTQLLDCRKEWDKVQEKETFRTRKWIAFGLLAAFIVILLMFIFG